MYVPTWRRNVFFILSCCKLTSFRFFFLLFELHVAIIYSQFDDKTFSKIGVRWDFPLGLPIFFRYVLRVGTYVKYTQKLWNFWTKKCYVVSRAFYEMIEKKIIGQICSPLPLILLLKETSPRLVSGKLDRKYETEGKGLCLNRPFRAKIKNANAKSHFHKSIFDAERCVELFPRFSVFRFLKSNI